MGGFFYSNSAMNKTLIISDKNDPELNQVAVAWLSNGGEVKRLGKYWIKDEDLSKKEIVLYGSQTFSLVLAQIYNVKLISPGDNLILNIEEKWLKRDIEQKKLQELTRQSFPVFIKPFVPKAFIAGIFLTLDDFKKVSLGLPRDEFLLTSTIIHDIKAEVRCFISQGELKDLACYEGESDLLSAKNFVTDFLNHNKNKLPSTLVIDLGYSEKLNWFILEFNASWGAGLNGCDAIKILSCIEKATINNA